MSEVRAAFDDSDNGCSPYEYDFSDKPAWTVSGIFQFIDGYRGRL